MEEIAAANMEIEAANMEIETAKNDLELAANTITELKRRLAAAEEKAKDLKQKLDKKTHPWSQMDFHPFKSAAEAIGWFGARSPKWTEAATKDMLDLTVQRHSRLLCSSIDHHFSRARYTSTM